MTKRSDVLFVVSLLWSIKADTSTGNWAVAFSALSLVGFVATLIVLFIEKE